MTDTLYAARSVVILKRLFDIVLALVGLAISALLLLPIALAIRIDSKGPVLFRQLRIGRSLADRSELFWMFKFRTMRTDAEAGGAVWATRNDPRITRIGRFLRKTRIDEIPQLYNVLRGDMSLVGPRPERPGFYQKLEREIPFYAERTYGLRPGITGLAQVFQGYDASIEDVRSKVSYDHAYALCLSHSRTWLAMDFEIMLRTIGVMFGARGQ